MFLLETARNVLFDRVDKFIKIVDSRFFFESSNSIDVHIEL